ncbi:helix-turn-helix transcriptional regulator [Vibrio parahaemolyticus]|nr:helix-turn-helix transcriptional regulator [Vibrio parahaemolyticus]MBE4408491.1 helix-turn-helix transcriptional regulator [Vibrio parahaemolyticus]
MFTFVFIRLTCVNVNKINGIGSSEMYGKLFTDSSYDHRKVLNAPDVIKAISQLGYTYDDIADACGLSKTMISRWADKNNKSLPTKHQLTPMLRKIGAGRVICDVEVLSPAAKQYPPIFFYNFSNNLCSDTSCPSLVAYSRTLYFRHRNLR